MLNAYLPGSSGSLPHAALASLHQLAVPVVRAGQVDAGLAGVGDDHADVADFDDRLRDHLDGGEEAVDVVRAFDQHLQLAAAQAAGLQEALGVLEVVVIGVRAVWDHRRRRAQ